MTPDRHAQAKELFLRAREVSAEDRDEFIRRECGQDSELYDEVASLIRFDTSATILVQRTPSVADSPNHVLRGDTRVFGRIERVAIRILKELFGSWRRRLVALTGLFVLLLGLAWWMYAGMRKSSERIAASELQTILKADVTALELWIEEKKKDVRIWSSVPEIREAVNDLTKIAKQESDPTPQLRASAALEDLRTLSEQFDRIIDRPEEDGVISRDGMILAAALDDHVGMRLNTEGMSKLLPVFQGETRFLRPHPLGAYGDLSTPNRNYPMVFVVAPIRRGDETANDEVIAAAAFGFPADDEFSRILSVARQGESGETYAFDENGLLLNESRFDPQLRKLGLLADDPNVRSVLRIEVRDPGPQPSPTPATEVETAARPLTKIAAKAIAAGRKGDEAELNGVIVEPYRNYRGALVIGAWRWLPRYSMAVVTEVEVAEQFAPMRFPLVAEWIRFALLTASVLLLFGAASWIVMLGRDLELARQLGQYTIEDEIGRGGMGVVYRARHALLHRPTAIKLLRPETVNEASLARFDREVQLASALTHPNTIEIFDFGRTPDGSFYCVMELLKGKTLEQIVRDEGPMPAGRALNILSQIAGSLNEAHQQGLVHRDIKPSNIMVCEQGGIADFVKVLDFGLARTVERSDGQEITRVGLVVGTPPYLAPECITDPITIDQRSDLYSFGALAFYLLSGQPTYEAENTGELIHQIVNEPPRTLSQVLNVTIPPELEEFIVRCLAKRPEDRPESFQEAIKQIDQIAKNLIRATLLHQIEAKAESTS